MELDVVDLDHVAIRVSDLETSLRFYHDLLGMPIRDRDRFEADAVPYVAVVAGGRHLHLVPSPNAPIDVGGEHVCLLLRSDRTDSRAALQDVIDRLEREGVTVEPGEPRKRYGAYGRDWAVYVRDPDDRRVELKVH